MGADVYQKVTDIIVGQLEKGVRPWFQPWNADHAAGRITKPLRGNGVPYRGINIIMLWSAAVEKGYSAPIWLSGASAKLLRHLARRRPRGGARGGAAVYGPRRKDACARSSTRWRAGRLLRSRARSRSGGL